MLSKPELRKLIRAHNVLSKITIPKGASLDDMVKMVEKAGYKVNHEKKRLDAKVKRGKQITLKQAEEITKPKPKTALQKQKAEEKKEEKAVEQKKKERDIRKKAVAEEKKRQKKMPKKDIKDKTQSISKVEKKKMPPKITAEQMKSIKVIEPKKKKKIIKKSKTEPLTEAQQVKKTSDANVKNAQEEFQKFFVGKLDFFDDKVRDKAIKDGVIKSNGDLNLDFFAIDSFPNYMATLNITSQQRGKGKKIEGTEGGKQGKGIPYLQIISEYEAMTSKERASKKDIRTNYRLKSIE